MRMKYVLALLITFLVTACSPVDSTRVFDNEQAARVLEQNLTPRPTKQRILIDRSTTRDWQRIDLSFGTVGSPIILVPPRATFSDWTQSISTQIRAYYHFPNMTAQRFVDQQIQTAKSHCTKVSTSILEHTTSFIVYELNVAECKDEKNMIRIGKAFNGIDAVYVVHYDALTDRISDAEIDKLSQVIFSAKLT